MKHEASAKPYAKALFALAKERGQAEAIGGELDSLVTLVEHDVELAKFFSWPWISAAVKRRVATEVATRSGVSKLTADFLALVVGHGRADYLDAIAAAYRDLLDQDAGRVRARVRTAVPLTDAERRTLAAKLSAALGGRTVALEEVVDATLLGGFIAESGSVVVDGSLNGQLDRLRMRLATG